MERRPIATTTALKRARALIDAHYASPLTMERVALAVGFSPYHFIRAFRSTYGSTPYQYLTQRRIDEARRLLRQDELSVTEIAFAVGFESPGSFSTRFRQAIGHAPHSYRRQVFRGIYVPRPFVPACFLRRPGLR